MVEPPCSLSMPHQNVAPLVPVLRSHFTESVLLVPFETMMPFPSKVKEVDEAVSVETGFFTLEPVVSATPNRVKELAVREVVSSAAASSVIVERKSCNAHIFSGS